MPVMHRLVDTLPLNQQIHQISCFELILSAVDRITSQLPVLRHLTLQNIHHPRATSLLYDTPKPEDSPTLLFHPASQLCTLTMIDPLLRSAYPLILDSLGAIHVHNVAVCLDMLDMPCWRRDLFSPFLPLDSMGLNHLTLDKRFSYLTLTETYLVRGGIEDAINTGFRHVPRLTLPVHFAASWPTFVCHHPSLTHLLLFQGAITIDNVDKPLTNAKLRETINVGLHTLLAKLSLDPAIIPDASTPPPFSNVAKTWIP
jgi:hypothetical protein